MPLLTFYTLTKKKGKWKMSLKYAYNTQSFLGDPFKAQYLLIIKVCFSLLLHVHCVCQMWLFASLFSIKGSRLKEQLDSGTYCSKDRGKREWLTYFMVHKFPLRYGVDISAFITLTILNHIAMPHITESQSHLPERFTFIHLAIERYAGSSYWRNMNKW